MKTPSPYPVLDNRPIDQWKVAELKEELKRRKLTIKGLKDDLVRRLAEALHDELESVKEDDGNNDFHATPLAVVHSDEERDLAHTSQPAAHTDDIGVLSGTLQPTVQTEDIGAMDGTSAPVTNADGEGEAVVYKKTESTMAHSNYADSRGNSGCDSGTNEDSVVLVTSVETNFVVDNVLPGKENYQDGKGTSGVDLVKNEEALVHVTSVETSVTVNESVTHNVAMDVQDLMKDDFQIVRDDSKTQFEGQESGIFQDVELTSSDPCDKVFEISTDVAFQVTQLEAELAKPPLDDVKLNSSDPTNQVSEVKTVLGFQAKSDSISSDSVSINEKNELKDNIIDENVKLELDVKPEMVHPSSSNVISDRSEPHPMDVEEICDKKEPVDTGDEKNANLEMSKKNDSLDVGLSEKLNLDRSSGDDFMNDDIMENKPIDSKCNSEVVDEGEKVEGTIMEEAPVVMSDVIPAVKKDIVDEMKKIPTVPIGKRKLNDQEVVGNNETSKRQRRWNSGTIKVPEPQSNTTSSTPKDTFPATALKCNFSRSDSTASEETLKERVVPPSPKSPTASLRIDRFLRPFTLKAVQELLGKTGSAISFWMDHIKTHCYVTYSSVEEAIETRNAVYNLQWPPNGGRLLLAEFVDPQEVKTRVEAPPSPTTTAGTGPTMLPPPPATGQLLRQHVQRQQPLPPPPSLPLPPPLPLTNPPQTRECLPPAPLEKMDTPIFTLDDLFRKTKATPRIYYLPLTDEQVTAKFRNIKQ